MGRLQYPYDMYSMTKQNRLAHMDLGDAGDFRVVGINVAPQHWWLRGFGCFLLGIDGPVYLCGLEILTRGRGQGIECFIGVHCLHLFTAQFLSLG